MTDNLTKIKEWKNQMDKIADDVTDLIEDRYIFNETVSLVKNNSNINKGSLFWDYLKINYISAMIIGICRQIDTDKSSLSLINLLYEIFECPELITKKWFTSFYIDSNADDVVMENYGISVFEEKFGNDNFVDPAIVYSDIGKLLFYTKDVKKFRNKRVAHKDKTEHIKIDVNFAKLEKALDVLEAITIKYSLLLNQGGFAGDSLMPTIQYDWKEIFYSPWINQRI